MFYASEIIKAVNGETVGFKNEILITGVCIDSRKVKKDDVFFAIKGDLFDGHDFVADVVKNGAKILIVRKDRLTDISEKIKNQKDVLIVGVDDTRYALGELARFYRNKFAIDVVGITGSCGKTTTKDMCSLVLGGHFKVLCNTGTHNNDIGLPMTLFNLKDHNACVVELGTNHAGEIKRLTDILEPSVGVITNIGSSHLEGLKDKEGVLKEKSTIFNSKNMKVCITNGDDSYLKTLNISKNKKSLTYGLAGDNFLWADDILFAKDHIEFNVNQKHKVFLNTLGTHNVYNALAALCVGCTLGLEIKEMINSFKQFNTANMRLQKFVIKDRIFINDAYNANPDSVKAAIDVLDRHYLGRRKIFVIADMLELGNNSDLLHSELGGYLASKNVNQLICIGEKASNIGKEALNNGFDDKAVFLCKNNQDAVNVLKNISQENDVILLKGSRNKKVEEIINAF